MFQSRRFSETINIIANHTVDCKTEWHLSCPMKMSICKQCRIRYIKLASDKCLHMMKESLLNQICVLTSELFQHLVRIASSTRCYADGEEGQGTTNRQNVLLLLLCWCFTALQHVSGNFGRGQLTYPHCSWASLLGLLPVLSAFSAHSFASN